MGDVFSIRRELGLEMRVRACHCQACQSLFPFLGCFNSEHIIRSSDWMGCSLGFALFLVWAHRLEDCYSSQSDVPQQAEGCESYAGLARLIKFQNSFFFPGSPSW